MAKNAPPEAQTHTASKGVYDTRQQPVGPGAHVDGLGRQPHRVDADHRSSSRIQAAHSLAALAGQVTKRAELLFERSGDHVGLQVADVLAGLSMRVVRDELAGRVDVSMRNAFRALVAASNEVTSVGTNLVLPMRICTALYE